MYYIIILGLSMSSSCSGFLVTSANDGIMKVWDIINHTDPCLVWEKKSNLGALQCLASNPDDPFVFIVGGDNKSCNHRVLNFSKIAEGKLYIIHE